MDQIEFVQTLAEDLRRRAEQCLANTSPSAVDAHELAVLSLQFLSAIRSSSGQFSGMPSEGGAPYRASASWSGERPGAVDESVQTAHVATLERALEDCQGQLHHALARLRAFERGDRQGP